MSARVASTPRDDPARCEVARCYHRHAEVVTHPQRGGLLVCRDHSERIRNLPADAGLGGETSR